MIISERFRTQEGNKLDILKRFYLLLKETAKGEPGETSVEQKTLVRKHQSRFEASIKQEKTKRKQVKQDRNKGGKLDLF